MKINKRVKNKIKRVMNALKEVPFYLTENSKDILYKEKIYVGGFGYSANFGDLLNLYLVEFLSEKPVIHSKFVKVNDQQIIYNVVGSILQWIDKKSTIWGAGFIAEDSNLRIKDLQFNAVRGPLTINKLKDYNINTNDIALGDPALLLPLMYSPKIESQYKVGIVPHYVDNDNVWLKNVYSKAPDTKVIDILCGKEWKKFIDEILSCDIILSSSLHGLIVAEAYNIPTVWISFSEKVIGSGFKFRDYYASIKVENPECVEIVSDTSLEDVIEKASFKQMRIDIVKLINSCPFITEKKRVKLLKRFENNNL